MSINSPRATTLAALLIICAAQQAGAQTLDLNGFAGSTISNANWSMTTLTPTLVSSTLATTFSTAFNNWNNSLAANKKWSLYLINTTTAKFTIAKYKPTLVGGDGDLLCQINYTAGGGSPTAITAAGPWNASNAVWSQSVLTNDPLAGALPGGTGGYLDNAYNNGNKPPAYPFQYVGSILWDDPSRSGILGKTVTWQADAMLSTINYTNRTIGIIGGVEWGFSISPKAAVAQLDDDDNDIGNAPGGNVAAVPEPAPTAALGLGLIGLCIRRRKRQL